MLRNQNASSLYYECYGRTFGGRPIDYFRIGTTGNNKSYWQDMRKGGYISIGWPKVGDLRQYGEIKKIEMKEKLRTKLEEHYQNDPRAIGRTASQILILL